MVLALAVAGEDEPWTDRFLSEFEGIKTQLSGIEQAQQDILAQKNKIIEEIDRTRVWARHSGG